MSQNVQVKSQIAMELAQQMRNIHEEVGAVIAHAQRLMKKQYDKGKQLSQDYQQGDRVWLDGQEITTDRRSKKVGNSRYGPFRVEDKVGGAAYLLRLPKTWKGI